MNLLRTKYSFFTIFVLKIGLPEKEYRLLIRFIYCEEILNLPVLHSLRINFPYSVQIQKNTKQQITEPTLHVSKQLMWKINSPPVFVFIQTLLDFDLFLLKNGLSPFKKNILFASMKAL